MAKGATRTLACAFVRKPQALGEPIDAIGWDAPDDYPGRLRHGRRRPLSRPAVHRGARLSPPLERQQQRAIGAVGQAELQRVALRGEFGVGFAHAPAGVRDARLRRFGEGCRPAIGFAARRGARPIERYAAGAASLTASATARVPLQPVAAPTRVALTRSYVPGAIAPPRRSDAAAAATTSSPTRNLPRRVRRHVVAGDRSRCRRRRFGRRCCDAAASTPRAAQRRRS